ncbi:hypothetical protein ACRQ5Q_14510 [Bradyrhizobium sp. PMVTL-01]|uniref:hypothetical protein n=1 Tax=Bradyrhizobium sp. PMVTL-01 TaxID=3434999 RepID=UPI003F719468
MLPNYPCTIVRRQVLLSLQLAREKARRMGVPKLADIEVDNHIPVTYKDPAVRYVALDTIEVTVTSEQSGKEIALAMSVGTMLELISKFSGVINRYNAEILRDLGIL